MRSRESQPANFPPTLDFYGMVNTQDNRTHFTDNCQALKSQGY